MLPKLVFLKYIDNYFCILCVHSPHEQTTFVVSNHLLSFTLLFGEQADGEKVFLSSAERGGTVFILWASEGGREGGREGTRAALPSMLPSSLITSLLPFSASRSLAVFRVVIFPSFIYSPPLVSGQ